MRPATLWLALVMLRWVGREIPVNAKPPQDPVQCSDHGTRNCTILNAYGAWPDRADCVASAAAFPATEAELVAAVAQAVRLGRKVKVISAWAHSIPKLACPGGDDGLVISTGRYNARVVVDEKRRTAEVDAGVTLQHLVAAAAEHGLALPYTPYWGGVSVGGLLSTGAHGSSWFQRGGAVHEYVVGMRLVVPADEAQGYARVLVLNESDQPDELNAARVGLGVLGGISTVTLQLEPMFKLSITLRHSTDEDLEGKLKDFGLQYEFADLNWYPSRNMVVYKEGSRVPATIDGDGVNDFIGFQPIYPRIVEGVRGLETLMEKTNDPIGKCTTSTLQLSALSSLAYGLKNNDKLFTGYPVIGFHNRLIASSNCLHTPEVDDRVCGWDNRIEGLFFHQTSVSIDISKVSDFIQDVKSLQDQNPSFLCGISLYDGFFMRFVRNSTAFLAQQQYDAVNFDITYYRSRDPFAPRLYEDVLEEIEQIAVIKYDGRPHWGKNRPVAFIDVAHKYPNIGRFVTIKNWFDPQSLFSSDWSNAMLGLGPLPLSTSPGCALEGLCICSSDAHCAPQFGYYCEAGRIYQEARVCRKVMNNDNKVTGKPRL